MKEKKPKGRYVSLKTAWEKDGRRREHQMKGVPGAGKGTKDKSPVVGICPDTPPSMRKSIWEENLSLIWVIF